jgi:hypothetical protein
MESAVNFSTYCWRDLLLLLVTNSSRLPSRRIAASACDGGRECLLRCPPTHSAPSSAAVQSLPSAACRHPHLGGVAHSLVPPPDDAVTIQDDGADAIKHGRPLAGRRHPGAAGGCSSPRGHADARAACGFVCAFVCLPGSRGAQPAAACARASLGAFARLWPGACAQHAGRVPTWSCCHPSRRLKQGRACGAFGAPAIGCRRRGGEHACWRERRRSGWYLDYATVMRVGLRAHA